MSRLKGKRLSIIALFMVLSMLFTFGYSRQTIVTHSQEKQASSKYVTLDSTTFSCNKGMTVTIGAKGSSAIKTYTTSDKSIATVKKSSQSASCKNCVNLDIYCKAKGNATITVTGKDGAKATLKVSVTTSGAEITNKYLNLSKTNVTCEKGKSVNITASGSSKFSKASTANKSLATISKNDSKAASCKNCYTLTIKCKAEGSVSFTVTGKDGATAKGKITIKANKTDPETLKADKTSIYCTEGTTKEIKLTGDFGKYKSSNTKLVTVSVSPNNAKKCPTEKGCSIDSCPTYKPECEILQISCLKAGSTTVTVESARGTKKVNIKVTVKKKGSTTQKDDVAFEKSSYTCDMSKSTSFNIKVKTKNTSIKSIETSDSKVATIKLGKSSKSNGITTYTAKVTCLQDGKVNVTAVDNKSKKAVVQLEVKNGGNISLPKSLSCKAGETKVINVQATKPNSGTAGIKKFSSSDKSVASVSKNGAASLYCEGCLILNVKCVKEGKTKLTVTSTTGATAKTTVTVNSAKIPNKIEFTSSSYKCDVSKGNKTITTYVTAGIDKITEVKSTNSSIASVSYSQTSAPSGSTDKIYLVKITCKSYGSVRIKAKTEKNVEGSAKVTVTNETAAKKDSVTFKSSSYECQKGKTINVTATSSTSTISKITSSDEKIAKVTGMMASLLTNDQYLKSSDGYLNVSNCAYLKAYDSKCTDTSKCMTAVANCAVFTGDVTTATVSCIKNGTVTLTATSAVGAKGTAKLKVKSTLSKAKVTFGEDYKCQAGKTITGLVKITNATNTEKQQETIKSVKSSDTTIAKIELVGDTYYTKSKPTERFQKVKITCIKKGTAKLTATTNLSAKGTGKVTVSAASSDPVVETSVKFEKDSYSCTVGKNTTVKVIVTGKTTLQTAYSNNFLIGNLVYSSKTEDKKTSTITYTLKMSCLRAGTTTLTAVTKDGKTASATLTSKKEDPKPEKTIAFNASKLSCTAGKSLITKINTTGGEKVKSVSSADKSIATIELSDLFSYNTTGTYAVLIKCLKKGDTTVTATSTSGLTAKATVSVSSSSSTVKVTKVTLNKDSLSLKVGGSGSLTATVSPSNATNKTITWKSSNTSVATVDNGKVKAIAVGTATITAKSHNGITATAKVTVSEATGSPKITTDPTSLKLKVGKSGSIVAKATNDAGGDYLIAARVKSASSSDTKIATIEQHPTVQVDCINCMNYLVTCKKKGSATLTFKSNQGAKTTAKVTCEEDNTVPVTSVDVYDMTMHLMLGYAASVPYTIEPSNASNKTLTWKSSNEKVATVNDGIVYAIGEGNAVITATAHNGKKDTMKVSVTKKQAKYMDLDTESITCKAGGTASIIAMGTSSIKSFKSSNTGVAKIAKHPLLIVYCDKCAAYQVTCVKSGTSTITVTGTDGAKGTAKVTVK